MYAEGALDVLARELVRPAADLLDYIPPPELEGPGGAEHEIHARPRRAVVEERAQVVERLEREQRPCVRPDPLEPLFERAGGVARVLEVTRQADGVLRVAGDLAHRAGQRRGREGHVGVDPADVAV